MSIIYSEKLDRYIDTDLLDDEEIDNEQLLEDLKKTCDVYMDSVKGLLLKIEELEDTQEARLNIIEFLSKL